MPNRLHLSVPYLTSKTGFREHNRGWGSLGHQAPGSPSTEEGPMRHLVLTAVAVAFAAVLASFAPRAPSSVAYDGGEVPALSPYEITLATPALPGAPATDAH